MVCHPSFAELQPASEETAHSQCTAILAFNADCQRLPTAIAVARSSLHLSVPQTASSYVCAGAQGRVFSNREQVPSPAGFPSPSAAAPAAGASALTTILQGLLAQQQATGGRDPAVNAQVQAVLAAIASSSTSAAPAMPAPPSGVGAASGPGSRRASAGPGLLATLMQNAASGPGALQTPGVVSA